MLIRRLRVNSPKGRRNMQFDFIAAVDSKWGLAKNGNLPWKGTPAGREDMGWFKQMTILPGTALIMGRKTWESIPAKFRPLPGRTNIVVSTEHKDGVTITGALTDTPVVNIGSFDAALKWCAEAVKMKKGISKCMVIGGKTLYEQSMRSPFLRYGYVTKIPSDFGCDLTLNALDNYPFEDVSGDNSINQYLVYDFSNKDELAYLKLLERLLNAPYRQNRTGVLTRGLFHEVLKFRLYEPGRGNILPMMTTKKVIWRSVYHELIWLLRGSTDTDYLKENNVHIWDGNSTREFLDSQGLEHYDEGELGPIYGKQWRAWGGIWWWKSSREKMEKLISPEKRCQGIDQLANVINTLKTNPWDRRMIVSAWNVEELPDMALAPCHYAFQFHVDPDENGNPKYLNCLVNMRSADVFCGVPFNAVSYGLLTHMIAHIVGLTPGTLSISMCDAHLYCNAIEQTKLQIARKPKRFPTIRFSPRASAKNLSIDDFTHKFSIDDYIIEDYFPAPYIKYDMVA